MIGPTIRTWRISAGFSQAAAARAIGTTPAYLCRVEQGKTVPPLRRLAELGRLYRVRAEVVGAAVLGAYWGTP